MICSLMIKSWVKSCLDVHVACFDKKRDLPSPFADQHKRFQYFSAQPFQDCSPCCQSYCRVLIIVNSIVLPKPFFIIEVDNRPWWPCGLMYNLTCCQGMVCVRSQILSSSINFSITLVYNKLHNNYRKFK